MPRKRSEILADEMTALRAEIKVVEDMETPTEEDLARAEACLDEWDGKKAELDKAIAREAKVDEVMRAQLSQANAEPGSQPARRGPEIMRRVDPYDEETFALLRRSAAQGADRVNFDTEPVVSRALAAADNIPQGMFETSVKRDKAVERLHYLVELDNVHAPLIARHMLMTGSDEYRMQFRQYIESGGGYQGELLRTAMSLSANGGVLVPFALDPTIILTSAGVASNIRSISTVKTIATKEWQGVTSAGVTTSWTAEGTETGDGTPTYDQPTITPRKADAWVFGSYEVFQDSGFAAQLGRLLADAKVIHEETAFATANATDTKPIGVVAGVAAVTASIVTAAATATFAIGDVYNTADAVTPRSENNLTWLANRRIYSKIRQFDTSGGGGFWANIGAGQPPELLGAPAYRCSPMTSTIASGTNILLVGDFAEYYVVDRIGMSVLYDPLIRSTGNNRPTGQAGWYAHWRVGANVVNADAFRLLQLNTTAAYTALATS